jgi:hypothetical protein
MALERDRVAFLLGGVDRITADSGGEVAVSKDRGLGGGKTGDGLGPGGSRADRPGFIIRVEDPGSIVFPGLRYRVLGNP